MIVEVKRRTVLCIKRSRMPYLAFRTEAILFLSLDLMGYQ